MNKLSWALSEAANLILDSAEKSLVVLMHDIDIITTSSSNSYIIDSEKLNKLSTINDNNREENNNHYSITHSNDNHTPNS